MSDKESYKVIEAHDRQKTLETNTFLYLKNHLCPNKDWDKRISPKERINLIRHSNVNWKTVSDHIKGMKYQDFLQTPYWKAIAAHSKFKAGYRCQVCDSPYDLTTHHRNYAIHGSEHAHIHELTVLCRYCHILFHKEIPKSTLKRQAAIVVLIIKLMILSAFVGHYLS